MSQTIADISPPHALIIGGHTDIGHLVINGFRKRGFTVTVTSSRFLENPLPSQWAQDVSYHHFDLHALSQGSVELFQKPYTHIVCLAPLNICTHLLEPLTAIGDSLKQIIFISSQNVSLDTYAPTYDKIRDMEARIHKTELPYIILRPTMLIGRKGKTLHRLTQFGRRFRFIPRIGHAFSLQQPVDYRDLAHAIGQACHTDIPLRQAYGLGGPEFMSLKRLYGRVTKHIPGPILTLPISTFILRILLVLAQRANINLPFDKEQIARAHKDKHCTSPFLPGWKPRFSLEESLDHADRAHHIGSETPK